MPLKPDADDIRAHMASLPKLLDASRRWWPKYVYHSAHVENAARILNAGCLLSRARVEADGSLTLVRRQLRDGLPVPVFFLFSKRGASRS